MENNAENRRRIARIAMESLSFEEMEKAIIYEFSERYKREPGLFDSVVQTLKEIDMLDDNKTYTCAGCEPEEQHPDVDYCDDCGGE
tara:strand:- start:1767 stop:2024 length:258 start_codon:yes stop_codon:yes gene_type:complete